jgi:hypothetical protein
MNFVIVVIGFVLQKLNPKLPVQELQMAAADRPSI